MGRRRTLSALALFVLVALALPAAAPAVVRIAVVPDPRGGPDKRFEVADSLGNGDIRLVQENQPNGQQAIAIFIPPSDAVQLGPGCSVRGGPPRARCETDGVTQIVVNLAEGNRPPTLPADVNKIDLTGVTQLTPDGSVPLPTVLSGGPGADTVTDGPGRLLASTLAGNDIINAGAGNDDIDDGPGNDIVLAGEGDDRFGDFHTPNSDILSGGPGRDQVISRGTVTLNDLLCNDGGNGDGPASPLGVARSVQAPEGTLQCSGTGADRDLFAGIEAVAQAFDNNAVDFTGSGADEFLQGQQGPDRLEGGGGRDTLLGFEGNDLLLGRDDTADGRVDCGDAVDDRAVVDQADPVEPNCENIERGRAGLPGPVGGGEPTPPFPGFPAPPPPFPPQGDQPSNPNEGDGAGGGDNGRTPPEVEIPTRVAFVRRGRIQIRVRCVYRAQSCVGRLTLRSAQNRRVGRRRIRRNERLARGSVNVPWGTSRATTLRAPRSLTRLLRALRGRTLKVRARVEVRDGAAPASARPARAARVVTLGLQR
jgi:RTX calcium-binding nonapeptide repeat (4 copies)